MIVVDLNVLVYATDTKTKHHIAARSWLDQALSGSGTVGMPTAVTVGYLRLVTNPRVMKHPLEISRAVETVSGWLGRPNVAVPHPTSRHYDILRSLVEATGVGGNIVSDAHLGALAIEHGAELCTFDADFKRFPGLVSFRPQ